jgi:hypothetical protein
MTPAINFSPVRATPAIKIAKIGYSRARRKLIHEKKP